MPTLEVNYEDLCSLLGKRVPADELEYVLPLIKCEVKSFLNGVFTLEVTADRPDMFSVEGVARILRGFLKLEAGCPKYLVKRGKVGVKVSRKVKTVRPYIACCVVRNVKLTDESVAQLMQLQEKLHETLCRRRSKGSIGIYDLDTVKPPITYTALKPGEIRFTPLDETQPMTAKEILTKTAKGMEYAHLLAGKLRYPLLLDSRGQVLSMPPIVNSEETRVTVETRNLFIDTTGMNPETVEDAVNIIASSLAERGGKVEAVLVEYPEGRKVWTGTLKPSTLTLNPSMVSEILGLNLKLTDVCSFLKRMRFNVKVKSGRLHVEIPSYRCDILHPVDLAEEVAIGFGYDKIKPDQPKVTSTGKELESTIFKRKIRDLMVGFGFQEIVSYILSSKELQAEKMLLGETEFMELANPLTSEYAVARVWLLPCLLEFLSRNLSRNVHVDHPQKIFECGDVILVDREAETGTRVEGRIAAAISDFKVSYEDIQAVAYSLLNQLKIGEWKVERLDHPSFIKGRAAKIVLEDGEELGFLGEVNPQVLEAFSLVNPTVSLEFKLKPLLKIKAKI
jgi:phenylalanyl-tRNA synthetase beta chain